MQTVCVFTPTFNRAYIIGELYESLKNQTLQDFVWLVVDDGSTDETKELFESYMAENAIPIIYERVKNGGKQRAHDYATSFCMNELFFCVDSDDYLVPDAIETIVRTWDEVRGDETIGGVLGLRGHDSEHPLGTWMPKGLQFSTQQELYGSLGFKGDVALVYRTDVMRRFTFDVEPGEKFIPETYVYFRIDQEYRCRLVNQVLQVGDYLPDGYTHEFPKNVIASPKSYLKHKRYCMEIARGFKNIWFSTVMYMVAHHLSEGTYGFEGSKSPLIAALAFPFAAILVHTKFR